MDDADVKAVALSLGRPSRVSNSPTPTEHRVDLAYTCPMVSSAVDEAMSTSTGVDWRIIPLTVGILGSIVA
jgi:hypothetical protein